MAQCSRRFAVAKREYGTGSVQWITTTKARLRVRVGGVRRSKVVSLSHRDHGGRGEATAALSAFRSEVAAELRAPKGDRTLGEVVDRYMAHLERLGSSPSTIAVHRNVRRQLGDRAERRLADLSPDELDDFYGELSRGGRMDSTIRITHSALRAALNQAVRWKWITANPALDATPPRGPGKPKHRITPEQVWAMIVRAGKAKDLGGEGDRVLAMGIFLATYVGARRGELCGLQWDDFDPESATLTICRQWVPHTGGHDLRPLKSETGSLDGSRVVVIGAQSIEVLERFRSYQFGLHGRADGWLLSHDGGATPIKPKSLSMGIAALGRKEGLTVSTHSLRRTASTQLMASGVDVDTASRRHGHTKAVMLAHYSLGADDRAVAAAHALEARLIDQGLPIAELMDDLDTPKEQP